VIAWLRKSIIPPLVDLINRAYSGERAAALAYIGHAGSLRLREKERATVRQIEEDEWEHRRLVRRLMEHEVFFQNMIEGEPWLPLFERIFHWGPETVANDVDLEALKPVSESKSYCRTRGNG